MAASRNCILAVAAVALFLGLLALLFGVTSRSVALTHCPKCGARYQPEDVVRRDVETTYNCRACTHTFDGPPVRSFSWLQAVENWLDP